MRNEDRYIGQERIDRNVQIDMNHWYVKPGQYVSSPNNTSYMCNPIMLQKYESTFISVMNFYSSTDYQQYDKTGPVVTNGKVGMSTI